MQSDRFRRLYRIRGYLRQIIVTVLIDFGFKVRVDQPAVKLVYTYFNNVPEVFCRQLYDHRDNRKRFRPQLIDRGRIATLSV